MNIKKNFLFIALATLFLSACSTSVERLDAQKEVDLSGSWNDTDSQLVAREMVEDSLSRAWISKFVKAEVC